MLEALKEYARNWRTVAKLRKRSGCFISFKAHFQIQTLEQLEMGKGSMICAGTVVCGQEYRKENSTRLIVGHDTYIGENNNIRIADSVIRIGNNCMISQMVSLIGSNHAVSSRTTLLKDSGLDYQKTGITIGDDVWIGCNAVILPGVTVGTGSVIAAGSVVTANVPEYSVMAGNPAKLIRTRQEK